ncbi:sugar ABC transporter ATP-binding protein [Arthrobacter ginkgonis]|uniref:Sugar ABC transporter ATP-binding protein n=1 Tax=Arthrobacter ginkgonis TaxID=1630594 RepID=A0ABP7CJ87_9MICC
MSFVEIHGISKSFGATKALSDVTMTLDRAEIHGLLGENGAGKSTLMKVLSGMVVPDTGSVQIDGHQVPFGHPRHARRAGLGIAYQELSSPPNITIAAKLCLPDLPRGPLGLVSRKKMALKASRILDKFGANHVDPEALIADVDLATRQQVEIIAAMSIDPKLLILDEPTAALPDTTWLFTQLRRLKESGCTVVYITHKLHEIEEICDRGTILRSGRTVGSFERGEKTDDELVELMIGRSFSKTFPPKPRGRDDGKPVLVAEGVAVGTRLKEATLTVRENEIVGIAGLEGHGQRELLYGLANLMPLVAGRVVVEPTETGTKTALVPEERKTEALFLEMSSAFNMTVGSLRKYSAGGIISKRRELRLAEEISKQVNLPRQLLTRRVGDLSGGNQQKAVFARTLSQDPRCLILFDPTRGVDAATKLELYDLMRKFADNGRGVVIYSTEIPELVGLCDRVYTVHGGRIRAEFTGGDITETNIMRSALNRVEVS